MRYSETKSHFIVNMTIKTSPKNLTSSKDNLKKIKSQTLAKHGTKEISIFTFDNSEVAKFSPQSQFQSEVSSSSKLADSLSSTTKRPGSKKNSKHQKSIEDFYKRELPVTPLSRFNSVDRQLTTLEIFTDFLICIFFCFSSCSDD